MKRGFDIAISLFMLPFLGVVLAAAALAHWIERDPGPLLFLQVRYGAHGRRFRIYKIRTMRVIDGGARFRQAQPDDPRTTATGKVLRATSLDELPQILNVLRGEMSLVGPRPHPTLLDDRFRKSIDGYDRRFQVKPGITGLAQVRGHRGPTETVEVMKERVDSDIEYVERASLRLDIEILFRTIFAVLGAKNAV